MNLSIALRLGRVSNLPTVWTNLLAGTVLVGGSIADVRSLPMALALTLFYVGGMFLNDAFDAEIDAVERPERPIPSGQISRGSVFTWGFGMLAASILLLLVTGTLLPGGTGLWPAFSGVALAGMIVLYNWHHKGNPLSPLIMGLCRVLVYLTAGLCFVVPLTAPILIGAALLAAYLIGLTYVAKQENLGQVKNMWPLAFLFAPVVYVATLAVALPVLWLFWLLLTGWIAVALRFILRRGPGDIPRAVVSLIAGISLLDAALIASAGQTALAILALAGFALTLFFQKFIAGT